jgi:hypothetical protein
MTTETPANISIQEFKALNYQEQLELVQSRGIESDTYEKWDDELLALFEWKGYRISNFWAYHDFVHNRIIASERRLSHK